jgi:flagellar filament outer layer protein Flaa
MIKKIIMLLTVLAISFTFGAYKATLIDFNVLGSYSNAEDTTNQKLYNGRWRATLNSSADFLLNRKWTYCKNVPVKDTKESLVFGSNTTSGNVLGVRVFFPRSGYNAQAKVFPMFEIASYAGADGKAYVGRGLLKNVGVIKQLSVMIKGKNFPHGLYIDLLDEDQMTKSYFFGYLDFNGWSTRIWENPAYLERLRDRRVIRVPLYPRVEPLIKLQSFTFTRDGEHVADNFIAYISWIKVDYDKAIISEDDDIDDEKVWGIQKYSSDIKAKNEADRLSSSDEMEELEKKKMNIDSEKK